MAMHHASDLHCEKCTEQFATSHTLAPADLAPKHELLVVLGHCAERLDHQRVDLVAENDVRRDSRSFLIQCFEPGTLPSLVRAEVQKGAEMNLATVFFGEKPLRRSDALKAVDDVAVVLDVEHAVLVLAEVATTDPNFDVGEPFAGPQGFHELVDVTPAGLFPLIGADLDVR